MKSIHVQLFANIKEKAGVSQVDLQVDDTATVDDLLAALIRRYPQIRHHLTEKIVISMNRQIVLRSDVLLPDAEVALLPPVGGGSLPFVKTSVRCEDCRFPYPATGFPFRCPQCGGLFEYTEYPTFDAKQVDQSQPGIWRYHHSFDLQGATPLLSLGEGNTPLLQDVVSGIEVAYKFEGANPSGSYKDRAMALILAQALGRGIKEAVEDSSGNAGASFAAYAARAKIKGSVFVPAHLSEAKGRQISIFGADLRKIEGPRSAAAAAVMEVVKQGAAYASHAYLPFGKRGIATIAYEIWEQLGQRCPGTVIAPVGHGHLLMGIIEGFEGLRQSGCIPGVPYMVGVQAENCAPIYDAWRLVMEAPRQVAELHTLAEGVSVTTPRQGRRLLSWFSNNRGEFASIAENEIEKSFYDLAHRGIYVEPTSALVWAAFCRLSEKLPQPVVLILTASGLKYTIND